jgi:hypothetical protein
VSDTASRYAQTLSPRYETEKVGRASKNQIPETLFGYGGEVIARASATGCYLVPDLEMGLEGVDFSYGFGSIGPRRRDIEFHFDKDHGGVVVHMVVPKEAADQTVLDMQQGRFNIWNLRELSESVRNAAYEAGLVGGKAAAEAMQITPMAAAESAQMTRQTIGDTVRETSLRPTHPTVMLAIEPAVTPAQINPLPEDANVAQVATRLMELTGLPDGKMGQLFPGQVSREHFHRWRSGNKDNPSPANRRRMWFLLRLFERLAQGAVSVREWVRNPTAIEDRTPFDLLRVGRFDEVEHLAARLLPAAEPEWIVSAEGIPALQEEGPATFTPRSEEPTVDLVFEDEGGWIEMDDLDDETDDG